VVSDVKRVYAMRDDSRSRHSVQSVERAFAVLRSFTAERPVQGVSEIATALNLNRTTVHRLLATLESCGAVRRDPITHRYTISAGVLQFANVFHQMSNVRDVAHQPMVRLRDITRHTAALHLREGYERVTISQVESNQDLRMTYRDLGVPQPLHLGAPGKVILANLCHDEIEEYIARRELIAFTDHSITDPATLRSELEKIRSGGISVSREERRPGVVSVAAPVFDVSGQVIGAMNICGPVHRVSDREIEEFIPIVRDAAWETSRRLGWVEHPLAESAG
jgi:IclR family transcriptional regulator, acetate operon repressor